MFDELQANWLRDHGGGVLLAAHLRLPTSLPFPSPYRDKGVGHRTQVNKGADARIEADHLGIEDLILPQPPRVARAAQVAAHFRTRATAPWRLADVPTFGWISGPHGTASLPGWSVDLRTLLP